jgi:uncharacterized BrkB/YihY/UPF0761 family membrane protein
VRQNLESVVGARGTLGAIGLIGLFWSGSAGFGAITRGVNRALGARRTAEIEGDIVASALEPEEWEALR